MNIKSFPFIAVVFIFFISGGYLILSSVYFTSKALHTTLWHPVAASVNDVVLKTYRSGGKHSSTTDIVKILYTYRVGNKKYTGNKIAVGYTLSNVENNSKLYGILSEAKTIEVYYNPWNPSKAVVVRGMNNSIVFWIMFTLVWNFTLLSFYIPISYFKDEINKRFIEEAY